MKSLNANPCIVWITIGVLFNTAASLANRPAFEL